MKNKIKNKMIEIGCQRYITVLILFILLSFTGACGSKEAVLLETEELVYEDKEEQEQQAARENKEEDTAITQEEEQMEESHLFIHICGAVQSPGVYELSQGSRIFDAVEAAGGFRGDACESYVNMALLLQDGWKIVIPTIEEIEENEIMSTEGHSGKEDTRAGITAGNTGVLAEEGSTASGQSGLVNINTAAKEALCSLPGIGESRAESIITYRENNGGFSKPEDIMNVEGIKDGMFSKLKDKICVK